MIFTIRPRGPAFFVDVFDGKRLVYVTAWPTIRSCLDFIENFNARDKNLCGAWTR